MSRSQFHPLVGLTEQEQVSANTREFTGDGTPYLKVAALVTLLGVRIGPQDIPLTQEISFPISAGDPPRMGHETLEIVKREALADGTPVLLRNIASNNGIWQAGVPIYVSGEWADEKPATSGETATHADTADPRADVVKRLTDGGISPEEAEEKADEILSASNGNKGAITQKINALIKSLTS